MAKKKSGDFNLWRKMGRDLKLLYELALIIRCDDDHQAMMGKHTWNHLESVLKHVSALKNQCEEEMSKSTGSTDITIFYGDPQQKIQDAIMTARDLLGNDPMQSDGGHSNSSTCA